MLNKIIEIVSVQQLSKEDGKNKVSVFLTAENGSHGVSLRSYSGNSIRITYIYIDRVTIYDTLNRYYTLRRYVADNQYLSMTEFGGT